MQQDELASDSFSLTLVFDNRLSVECPFVSADVFRRVVITPASPTRVPEKSRFVNDPPEQRMASLRAASEKRTQCARLKVSIAGAALTSPRTALVVVVFYYTHHRCIKWDDHVNAVNSFCASAHDGV